MYKIYRLVSEKGVYIGSTKQELDQRLKQHYQFNNVDRPCSSKNIMTNNTKIELIETCEEADRYEREAFWIKNTENVNINIPEKTFNYKEWYLDNKERILQKQNTKIECDKCGKYVCKNNLKRHKLACDNPQRVPSGELWTCPICNKTLRKDSKYRHSKICDNTK